MSLVSEVFVEAGHIPARYTADGKNESPPLLWAKAPSAALSLALLVEDPDAGTPAPFLHWLVYGISPLRQRLPPGIPPFGVDFIEQGLNSTLRRGYTGFAPPRGDRPHRYVFELFALDTPLPVPAGAGRSRVLRAMRGHVCAYGELMGTYARPH
jgi:Raf kinase inhibitor-like YbhB/YbcL family protein